MHDAIESAPSSQQSVDLLNAEILREQKDAKSRKSRLESVADRSASFHQSFHDSLHNQVVGTEDGRQRDRMTSYAGNEENSIHEVYCSDVQLYESKDL